VLYRTYNLSRTMSRWLKIAALADCPPGSAIELVAEDRIVALFNVDGTLHALDGVCPHQGGPLGQGELAGCIVTCPWHGWQFDVRSGEHQLNPRMKQPSFPVRIEDGAVLVDIEPSNGTDAEHP
jgi:nitrite reductase/ring-hydroxylating ferredoxin subunit